MLYFALHDEERDGVPKVWMGLHFVLLHLIALILTLAPGSSSTFQNVLGALLALKEGVRS